MSLFIWFLLILNYPFSEVIIDNKRKVVSNTLLQDETGKYTIDYEDFEEKIKKEKIKLFYRVFTDLKEEYKQISIVASAPSKTFNIAGLQLSNIFIPNPELKRKFKKQIDASGYSQLNVMGLVAAKAAYEHGGEWYEAMLKYVGENITFTKRFLEEKLPNIKFIETEGTYLLWLDFKALGLSELELEDLIIKKAKLWLDSGRIFGTAGKGFQRINAACPRATLIEALERLELAVKNV